jgi:hypothetical protein
MNRDELVMFVSREIDRMNEKEAIAALDHPYCTARVCQLVAESERLKGYYAVILRLVTHRATQQQYAMRLVPFLYWNDLLKFSTSVRVPPPVRRAMDVQLLARMSKLAVGQKISTARVCSREVAKALLYDPETRVFAALLNNARIHEEDLVAYVGSQRSAAPQLNLLAQHNRWSCRYAIRKALVTNPVTPKGIVVLQLRYLTPDDLRTLYRDPATSVYVKRCIETVSGRSPD